MKSQGGVSLVMDDAACNAGPLIRGLGPPHRSRDGRRITDPAQMRAHLRGVVGSQGHLAAWSKAHPAAVALAVTGCGNLGMNPGVLAWRGGSAQVWGAAGHYEHRVFSSGQGRGEMQSRAEVESSSELLAHPAWAVSGPSLVVEAQPALSSAESFADPRHRLLFPYLEVVPGSWADFGCDAMLRDVELYRAAVAGEVVRLPLQEWLPSTDAIDCSLVVHDIDPSTLTQALETKGYAPSRCPSQPGSYSIEGRDLVIAFLPGIYPHHVLALDADGSLCSVLVTGLSNRAGVTLDALAQWLVAVGFKDALLLDNGGDVGLLDARSQEFVVRPAEPDRRETWPVTACLVFAQS